ncbi:flagellar basal body-associated FliL family protein [Novosphingobium mangrovi (ex Huang et al. 2023)]|uniref:Flagellar protein FliL n=1 Tax=Novosphingobium mangrovi (ex Huang et al. 2023) TaxID=2976432 RepID=A0ABT2I055_9SPHN|nr:flagellar basal body-associated FliL family protein [Novosphingobium mangrovi (ex Huang et al. 2023)]MCT2398175.1 flagellar basal body-associated FliL family protein [Novosphingobium mangrovi (ex Huang et al. 2023)]
MTDKHAKDGKKKSSGKIALMIGLGAAGMLVIGAGGVYALVATGVIGGSHAQEERQRGPQLVLKGQEDPYMPKPKEGEHDPAMDVEGEGGDEYRTVYFTFSEPFTSNLKDSDALIQTSVACSTRRDGRVLIWLQKHELAIRSKLLQILADTPEDDVYTIEGKEHLQKRMTSVINDVLTQKEGFGGVDAVYFRSFIIQ